MAGLPFKYVCDTSKLRVNTNKSKVMYVYESKRAHNKLPSMLYNRNVLHCVDNLKYLGLCFTKTTNINKSLKNLCQYASRAQTVVNLHDSKYPSVPINQIFELFDRLLNAMITYGCEFRGVKHFKIVEQYQLIIVKNILQVKSTSTTYMIYTDLYYLLISTYP